MVQYGELCNQLNIRQILQIVVATRGQVHRDIGDRRELCGDSCYHDKRQEAVRELIS